MEMQKVEQFILELLKRDLPENLTYHKPHHTFDVYHAAKRLAELEQVRGIELVLLKTAALYHDVGYVAQYQNHEEASCQIARETLPILAFEARHIDRICTLIMATKKPHRPHDHLEKILVDADLDYLGRDDFYPLSQTLFAEWQAYGLVDGEREWQYLQVQFLENHRYFTPTALLLREAQKQARLQELRSLLAGYAAKSA